MKILQIYLEEENRKRKRRFWIEFEQETGGFSVETFPFFQSPYHIAPRSFIVCKKVL
jgi:hypothetical protein